MDHTPSVLMILMRNAEINVITGRMRSLSLHTDGLKSLVEVNFGLYARDFCQNISQRLSKSRRVFHAKKLKIKKAVDLLRLPAVSIVTMNYYTDSRTGVMVFNLPV